MVGGTGVPPVQAQAKACGYRKYLLEISGKFGRFICYRSFDLFPGQTCRAGKRSASRRLAYFEFGLRAGLVNKEKHPKRKKINVGCVPRNIFGAYNAPYEGYFQSSRS